MIALYFYPECFYCQKVIKVIRQLDLKEHKDIAYKLAYPGTEERKELVELGGMPQVPFIIDGDVRMYESEDIIRYLKKKFSPHQGG